MLFWKTKYYRDLQFLNITSLALFICIAYSIRVFHLEANGALVFCLITSNWRVGAASSSTTFPWMVLRKTPEEESNR
jgi:hypothetical protein